MLAPGPIEIDGNALSPHRRQHSPVTMSDILIPAFPDPDPVVEEILESIAVELKKLKETPSPDTYPKASSALRVKPHAQLVKEKLLPIGEHIIEHANGDGTLELRLW